MHGSWTRRALVFSVLLPALLGISWALPSVGTHIDEGIWRCDGGYCRDGEHRMLDCSEGFCTGSRNGFPTIVAAHYDDGAWLADDARVIGVSLNGDAAAFPIRIVNWFETVNVTIGGNPVIVSFCPLCGSGIVYSRVVDATELTFLNTGAIWKNDLVLYDVETGTTWTQIGGDGLEGPRHGQALTLVASQHVTWRAWKDTHPETRVLARPVAEDGSWLAPYDQEPRGPADVKGGLSRSTGVHGIVSPAGNAYAFPLPVLRDERVVPLSFGGQRLVAAFAADDVHVYVVGERTFKAAADGIMVDQHGNRYDVLTGRSDTAPSLSRVPGRTTYWYAWEDFHPDTGLYRGSDYEPPAPRTPGPEQEQTAETSAPGYGLAIMIVAAALVASARNARPGTVRPQRRR